MTIAAAITLPEAVASVCRRYSVKELAVFGSAARGLLVEFQPDAQIGLIEHIELPGRSVDLVSKRAPRSQLRETVLAEAGAL